MLSPSMRLSVTTNIIEQAIKKNDMFKKNIEHIREIIEKIEP